MRQLLLPLLMGACAAGALALRGPLAEANAGRRVPGTGFVPKASLAKLFSAGHRSTLADLLWLGAIGDLSREFPDPQQKRSWLDTIFTTVPALEPGFTSVYSFGATYLTMLTDDADRAIELLERGVAANPGNLRLAVELAMVWYMQRHDREKALEVLEPVVRDPRCDSITMGFYASLLVDQRQDFAALAQWAAWLDHGSELVRENAELQLERAKRKIAIRAADEFRERTGRSPRTPDDLRLPGLIAPEAVDLVLDTMWIDVAGKLEFDRCAELEARHALRAASRWVLQFRAENGRTPTFDELMNNRWVRLPPPPAGKRYDVVGDAVALVDEG
jgi:hypothetical protein